MPSVVRYHRQHVVVPEMARDVSPLVQGGVQTIHGVTQPMAGAIAIARREPRRHSMCAPGLLTPTFRCVAKCAPGLMMTPTFPCAFRRYGPTCARWLLTPTCAFSGHGLTTIIFAATQHNIAMTGIRTCIDAARNH